MRAVIQLTPGPGDASLLTICSLLQACDWDIEVCSPLGFDEEQGTALLRPVKVAVGKGEAMPGNTLVFGKPRRAKPVCDLFFMRGSGILADEPWSRMIARVRAQHALVESWRAEGVIGYCLNPPPSQLRVLDKTEMYGRGLGPLPRRFGPGSIEEGIALVREEGAIVKKPRFGLRGCGILLLQACESDPDLRGKLDDRFRDPMDLFLFQEYVDAVEREGTRRLVLIGGEVEAAARFTNPAGFITNLSRGGKMSAYQPSSEEILVAKRCARAFSLDLCAVDFIGPYVLELNGSGIGLRTLREFPLRGRASARAGNRSGKPGISESLAPLAQLIAQKTRV